MQKMKHIINSIYSLVIIFVLFSCNKGIDDITTVNSGPDETAPSVKIVYPAEGTIIKVMEKVTSIDIKLEASDDIEIDVISVKLNGAEIKTIDTFKDYRRALIELAYDKLTDGNHELSVTASDLDGKSTTEVVKFTKEPPYTPLFNHEFLYMPFDNDYMELVNIVEAAKVGNPAFADEGFIGSNAYMGASDSYLTYPFEQTSGKEMTAAFWYKVSGAPDRAGILVVGNNADDRNQGFRLFREGSANEQRIKLNVGTGSGESWNDGDVIDVTAGEWVHVAFAISETKSTIFFNGVEVRSSDMPAPIDWSGCKQLTIGAGGETFSYWDHKSDASAIDELRMFNKALTAAEIRNMINVTNPYKPKYDGESFYMPFEKSYTDLISNKEAVVTGNLNFAGEAKRGNNAFTAATNAYLTMPIDGMLGNQFSASFWYKVNGEPNRAGILVVGDDVADRNQGFRLFREGDGASQRIKLNVGTGNGESWNDGGVIDVKAGEWAHVVFTISESKSVIYFNGVQQNVADLGNAIDWTGCSNLTIGSGGETFSYWDHKSDLSNMDELRLFNKALSADEVQTIYNKEK